MAISRSSKFLYYIQSGIRNWTKILIISRTSSSLYIFLLVIKNVESCIVVLPVNDFRTHFKTVVPIPGRNKQTPISTCRSKVCTYRTKLCFFLFYLVKSFDLSPVSRIDHIWVCFAREDDVEICSVAADQRNLRNKIKRNKV